MKFGRSSPARTSGRTPCCDPAPRLLSYKSQNRGEVSERLKELASKASVGETRPWVQIPPSPPYLRPLWVSSPCLCPPSPRLPKSTARKLQARRQRQKLRYS